MPRGSLPRGLSPGGGGGGGKNRNSDNKHDKDIDRCSKSPAQREKGEFCGVFQRPEKREISAKLKATEYPKPGHIGSKGEIGRHIVMRG